ncbi:MAG: DUF3667 domain-containing protein [Alphaproteobacteria bacterium]|jgi:hypothetical protein
MDLDAIGAAATGGLIASAIEKPSGVAGAHQSACADCGTVTVGRFCHNCGNPSHVHRTLLHLGEELLHGVMHFDSRTWRTLPLLIFRPGQLTRDWVMGKRARYVSPLALFLFTIFVMFMALSYAPIVPEKLPATPGADVSGMVARAQASVAEAETALRSASGEARTGAVVRVAQARDELKRAIAAGREIDDFANAPDGDWKAELAARARSNTLGIETGNKSLDEKIRHKLVNPDLAIYKLQQTFYKFSFLLVPISIPFVALLFVWKRGVTLYDHGVFVLYSLTFMSALIMVGAVGDRLGVQTGWLVLAPPAHMFFQLKGAYGLRWFSALWRTVLLQLFCVIALGLFILSVIWLGLT